MSVAKFCCEYQEIESVPTIITQLSQLISSKFCCLNESLSFIEVFIEHKWTKNIWLYMKSADAKHLTTILNTVGFQFYQLDRWPSGLVRKTLPECVKLIENIKDLTKDTLQFVLQFQNYTSFGKTIKSLQEAKNAKGDQFDDSKSMMSFTSNAIFRQQNNAIPESHSNVLNAIPESHSNVLNQQFSQLNIQRQNDQSGEINQNINTLTQLVKGMIEQQQLLQQKFETQEQKFETQGNHLLEVVNKLKEQDSKTIQIIDKLKDQDSKTIQIIDKLKEQDNTISIIKRSIEIEMH